MPESAAAVAPAPGICQDKNEEEKIMAITGTSGKADQSR